MNHLPLDHDDVREAGIYKAIGVPFAILWRADLIWHPDEDPADRCLFGIIDTPTGPDLFLATARPGYQGEAAVSVHLIADLEAVAKTAPAFRMNVKATHDGAVVEALYDKGELRWVAKHLTVATAIHVVRIPAKRGMLPAIALTVSRFVRKGVARAEISLCFTRPDILVLYDTLREIRLEIANRKARSLKEKPDGTESHRD